MDFLLKILKCALISKLLLVSAASFSAEENIIVPEGRDIQQLDEATIRRLKDLPSIHRIPAVSNDNKTCCIATMTETRYDEQVNSVLLNMHQNLPTHWDLLIRCPNESIGNFTSLPAFEVVCKTERSIRVIPVFGLKDDSHWLQFSSLAKTPSFWAPLREYKHVLVFERDTVMCGPRKNHGIDDYLDYDYVGAPWNFRKTNRFYKKPIGNGGFSLRDPEWMIHCTQLLMIGAAKPFRADDTFFAKCLASLGAHLPSPSTAGHFAMERWGWPDMLALHQSKRFFHANLESLASSKHHRNSQFYDWGNTTEQVLVNLHKACPPLALISKELLFPLSKTQIFSSDDERK